MILVTGGAGFIGSHLVRLLLEAGARVRVLEHPSATVNHLDLSQVELVRADIRDRVEVERAVHGCRQVYHLAANPNLWTYPRREFDAVNHRGTVHVLEAAIAEGVERVLHVSTESILTSPRFAGGAVENLRPKRADMVGPYCLSKFEAERAAFALADAGRPVLVASPTLPVGPGDHRLSPPSRMTLACARGELPAYLDCRFNMIDVRDVALGLARVMERGVPRRRYLLGAWNIELRDWLTMVAKATGQTPPRFAVPYRVALAIGYLSEAWADLVTRQMPQATVTGVKLTRYTMHFDPSATLRELDLEPRPLTESLHDFLEDARIQGRWGGAIMKAHEKHKGSNS